MNDENLDTGNTQETAEAQEVQEQEVQEQEQQAPEAQWHYADNVPGEGVAPDWFKGDKYKTVEAQAKAYKELEGKLGAFTGAPEEYTLELSQEIQEKGIEIEDDDHILLAAKEYAKEMNMSQEGFGKLVDMYVMTKLAEQEAVSQWKAEEMKALGDNAQGRIDNLAAWANKNLPPELMPGFKEMANTAESVKAMEQIVGMTRSAAMNPQDVTPAGGNTEADVKRMQFEKDEYGNRRIQTDPAFRKEYEKMRDEVYGTEPFRKRVG